MGIVYAARDGRLQRLVALKTMAALAGDERARARFRREARVAASLTHPGLCRIYDFGEDHGELFIVMELLEGETLGERLAGGAMAVADALPIALAILAALSALHARGIVHRDLKPANVFLTPDGVKLLDFGLARREAPPSPDSVTGLTHGGTLLGTPGYMAPEQATGGPVDQRSDLFAAGALLFELLAGRRAFAGRTTIEILHATIHEQPPALTGGPAVAAVDREIRRALAKRPDDRPPSAGAMATGLRAALAMDEGHAPVLARSFIRLAVLPFRVLRPDPETDFLAFSLADAVATSLSSIESLVVRSAATAARFASATPDLKALAAEADVERVVLGTLLRSGAHVRVVAQLVEAPAGTLLASHTVQSQLGDWFSLQDDLARRVAHALALPLTGGPTAAADDAPRDAAAYDLYLRANELARTYGGLAQARELYERCLDLDAQFAPAWAHLGRCHRVFGKFVQGAPDSESRARLALDRALALNPRLPVAHKFYASLEGDVGDARQGLLRLLGQANRHGNDAELFAGLVSACRYGGLYDASIAAHVEARRLDPNVPTSLGHTLLLAGEIARLLALERPAPGTSGHEWMHCRITALGLAGRLDEARRGLAEMREGPRVAAFETTADLLAAWLDRRPAAMLDVVTTARPLGLHQDPEFLFRVGWLLCDVGGHEPGLIYLSQAITKAYCAAPTLATSRSFEPLRSAPRFRALRAEAEEGRRLARAAFSAAGGTRLLGAVSDRLASNASAPAG
jgi:TolB-like protein